MFNLFFKKKASVSANELNAAAVIQKQLDRIRLEITEHLLLRKRNIDKVFIKEGEETKKSIDTKDLGEIYFGLVVEETDREFREYPQLMKDIGISINQDSFREINALGLFAFINALKFCMIDRNIAQSIINYIGDTFVDFFMHIKPMDDLMCKESSKLGDFINLRFTQYDEIWNKLLKDTSNKSIMECGRDVHKTLRDITSMECSDENVFPMIYFFIFFWSKFAAQEETMALIFNDIKRYDIKVTTLSEFFQKRFGDEFDVSENGGTINMKRKNI